MRVKQHQRRPSSAPSFTNNRNKSTIGSKQRSARVKTIDIRFKRNNNKENKQASASSSLSGYSARRQSSCEQVKMESHGNLKKVFSESKQKRRPTTAPNSLRPQQHKQLSFLRFDPGMPGDPMVIQTNESNTKEKKGLTNPHGEMDDENYNTNADSLSDSTCVSSNGENTEKKDCKEETSSIGGIIEARIKRMENHAELSASRLNDLLERLRTEAEIKLN